MTEAVEHSGAVLEKKPYNESYFVYMEKSVGELSDRDYDEILNEAERRFGKKFEGNRELAKFYMDEFLAGVVLPIEQQGDKKLIKKLKLGLVDAESALARGGVTAHPETGKLVNTVYIDFRTLEHMTFFDADEDYCDFREEDEVSRGPTWFAARQLGIEEGAHAEFVIKNNGWEHVGDVSSEVEYHQTDVELDGLKWRIYDSEKLLTDPFLSKVEQVSIAQYLQKLKRLRVEALAVRADRVKPYGRFRIIDKRPLRKH